MKSGTFEPAAATDGMEPMLGVGLDIITEPFWSATRAKLASVAMLEADILRAGDAGRAALVKGEGDGWCRAGVLFCDGCRTIAGTGGAAVGADVAVGVACGVEAAEFATPTEMGAGVCLDTFATGCWWW